jgi:hypothetical protein
MAVFLGAFRAALICFRAPGFEVGGGDVEGVLEMVALMFSDDFGEEAGAIADVDYWLGGMSEYFDSVVMKWRVFYCCREKKKKGGLTLFACIALEVFIPTLKIRHDTNTLWIRMFLLMLWMLLLRPAILAQFLAAVKVLHTYPTKINCIVALNGCRYG